MLDVQSSAEGLVVQADAYRLSFPADRPYAMLEDREGRRWAELFLACSLHARSGLDDTPRLAAPAASRGDETITVTVGLESSLWRAKRLVFECRPDVLLAHLEVEGQGEIADCHLFGGYYSGHLRWGSGFFQSGARFRSLFNPEPYGSERRAIPSGESTVIDVMGTSVPGKGHWFFTPAPFLYAVNLNPVAGTSVTAGGSFGADQGGTPTGAGEAPPSAGTPATEGLPAGPWLGLGLVTQPGRHDYSGYHYDASEGAFSLRLAYEGQTRVYGEFRSPQVAFLFDAPDPYAAIASHTALLERESVVALPRAPQPEWWTKPILCGWGAQCYLANVHGGRAPELCRQEHYDSFLTALEEHGLQPGTVVLDDKWQAGYGTNAPDSDKWPDLQGWIARRHSAGQKVLLWWKAWDPEGLPAEQCVTNAAGMAVAADPSNPAYEATLRESVRNMLSANGLDADGFKVDFSARTPSGPGLRRHGREWGVELLHRLLWILHSEAKAVKPDALVITHAPNPYFSDCTDMVRLNDINTAQPIVAQMRHRAAVARAGLPNKLIDTDNWPMPDRQSWREYTLVQPELGVPALYFATHVDGSREALEPTDYELVRSAWQRSAGAEQ